MTSVTVAGYLSWSLTQRPSSVSRGCQKGRRIGYKCYLVYNNYEDYGGASRKCLERGGRLAMPRDRREQEALADYVKSFFHPGNWPVWLGINDLASEGNYVFDDGTQVSYFQWRKHFLSSQPDGARRENCVAMSSDDGDWWDHYCDRTMNYLCEFDDRVALWVSLTNSDVANNLFYPINDISKWLHLRTS